MANISVKELEKGLYELIKQPDGIKKLAVVIHAILEDMTSATTEVKKTMNAIFKNYQN